MTRASRAAAFAASLLFGSMPVAFAADDLQFDDARLENAHVAEECLLGSDDETARYLAYQPFTREIAANGIVAESLDAALAAAAVPATAMLEARQALATVIDLTSEVAAGDRFHVRYEQAFTAEGAPIGVGRVIWAELRTKAKGIVAIHRFSTRDKTEHFWLANGQAATPPSMRVPLDTVTVSSGFGWRRDPLDKPGATALAMGPLPEPAPSPAPATAASAPAPEKPVAAPPEEPAKRADRRTVRGSVPFGGQFAFGSTDSRSDAGWRDIERTLAARAAEARRAAAAQPVDQPAGTQHAADTAAGTQHAHVATPAPRAAPRLFMHDGVDLVAPTGTPVYAASDGVVVGAAPNGGYGNWIRIDNQATLATVYGHLSSFAPGIEAGVRVSKGELIGFVGNTGRSTGSHLHFEILSNSRPVDPLVYVEGKRPQLAGPDLERFRKQMKRAFAERDREAAVELSAGGF